MLPQLQRFLRAPLWEKINFLSHAGALLKTQAYYRFAFGSLGAGSILWRPVMLHNTRFVHVGKKVLIRDGARFDLVTEMGGVRFQPRVEIGDGSLFEQGLHLACAREIIIGRKVTVSRNVGILDVWHEYGDVTLPIIEQPLGASPVRIMDGVLIGMGSVILPGVTIGRQSIIGANSVVNRDVPDYCVAAGTPAHVIKRYDQEKNLWIRVSEEG